MNRELIPDLNIFKCRLFGLVAQAFWWSDKFQVLRGKTTVSQRKSSQSRFSMDVSVSLEFSLTASMLQISDSTNFWNYPVRSQVSHFLRVPWPHWRMINWIMASSERSKCHIISLNVYNDVYTQIRLCPEGFAKRGNNSVGNERVWYLRDKRCEKLFSVSVTKFNNPRQNWKLSLEDNALEYSTVKKYLENMNRLRILCRLIDGC